jgi:hypothetical protein
MRTIQHCFRDGNEGCTTGNKIQTLAYADDIDIVGQTVTSVKEALLALAAAAKTIGTKINEEKTKFKQVTKRLLTSSMIEIGSYNFKIV